MGGVLNRANMRSLLHACLAVACVLVIVSHLYQRQRGEDGKEPMDEESLLQTFEELDNNKIAAAVILPGSTKVHRKVKIARKADDKIPVTNDVHSFPPDVVRNMDLRVDPWYAFFPGVLFWGRKPRCGFARS